MKKILPILLLTIFFFFATVAPIFAQVGSTTPTPAPGSIVGSTPRSDCKVEDWECDPEVTFVGKLARRSLDTLDFVVGNYRWLELYDQTKGDPLQVLHSSCCLYHHLHPGRKHHRP